jgi:hypothetical protein
LHVRLACLFAAEPTPTPRGGNGACQKPLNVPTYGKGRAEAESDREMPSLVRFLLVLGVITGVVYGGLWSLAHLIEPKPREMTITIPQDRLSK